MVPIGRRLLLVSRASPESVLMRLGRNVTAKPTPGVPFSGRVYGSEFRIQPVWTWTPRGTSSPDAREAFGVPICSVHGAVSAVGDAPVAEWRPRDDAPIPALLAAIDSTNDVADARMPQVL